MTDQQKYDLEKEISRDPTISHDEALKRRQLLRAFSGTLTDFRELIRNRKPGQPSVPGYTLRPNITDRAKRYRAQRNAPPGRKLCNFCGSRENIDIDHVGGDEDDGSGANLIYLCRSCNTSKGIVQARNRIGVRTRQFNPIKIPTFAEFKAHARTLLGLGDGDPGTATAAVRSTPPAKRAAYAEKIAAANPFQSDAQRRKFFAMAARGEISQATLRKFAANPAAPSFKQYLFAIHHHAPGKHDDGGKIIHATPKAKRSEYASRIAAFKQKRRRADDVPF